MLHRDISPNNLMWAPGGSEQGQPSGDVGYLIDLDFAAIAEAGTAEQIDIEDLPHTLALPFLAIDYLLPDTFIEAQSPSTPTERRRHVYRHDLESFFWSLWWILLKTVCDTVRNKVSASSIEDLLSEWRLPNLRQNRDAKKDFLFRYKRISEITSQTLWPQHEHQGIMESFLNNMSFIIHKGHTDLEKGCDYITAGGHITYKNLMRVFQQGLYPQMLHGIYSPSDSGSRTAMNFSYVK